MSYLHEQKNCQVYCHTFILINFRVTSTVDTMEYEETIEIHVDPRGHANLDSLPFRYGFYFTAKSTIKLSNCNNEFEDVQRFVLPEVDFLWEDFDLVDVEDDGDIDIIISNNIQWGSAYESINEHKVILNDNGSFSIRSGNKSDIPYLPPHIALSWPTE